MPVVMANPEQPIPEPSAAPAVKTPTVTARKSTPRGQCKTRRNSNTTLKSIDRVEPEQLNPMPMVVLEPAVDNAIPGPNHEPHPSVATVVVEELPPTPKAQKRKLPASVFAFPRKRTRSTRSPATAVTAPAVIARTSTSSPVEPATTQNPPIAATVFEAPTITASELSQKIQHQTRSKSQRGIDRVAPEATQNPPIVATVFQSPTVTTTESSQKRKRQPRRKSQRGIDRVAPEATTKCPDFVDTQTLPDFMEVCISGFTLCKEFQETIFSLQAECTRITAESLAPLDDSMCHSLSDDVQIISDPSIPEPSPCVVFEECPPSPCLVVEEWPPSPKAKKMKSHVFISTLPRRRTRSARSIEEIVGWKNIEQALPILRPLSSVVKEVVVTQEPATQEETIPQEPASSQNLVVTQEPVVQEEIVPQEPVMPETAALVIVSSTQEPVTQNNEDVPLAQLFAQIEKKIRDTENSRIIELRKETESLKAELDSLKRELQVARQKNLEGITLDILALTKVFMDQNKELMCYECGNIYFQVGYKIVKVPVTGHAEEPTNLSVKIEYDLTVPQEPVRQRRSQRNRVVVGLPATFTQEPLLHTQTDYVLEYKAAQKDF
jgi:hypothetical protein